MKINKISPQEITFEKKFDTIKILETTTLKCIQSETISDIVPLVKELWPVPIKAFGNRGIRYYAQNIGNKITDKYPEIAEASLSILEFLRLNPKANKNELQKFVAQIVNKLGSSIDITI